MNSKTTTESQMSIHVRWLKKQGCLKPGAMGGLSWSRGSETPNISYSMEIDRMILLYWCRQYGKEWEKVVQPITFDRTPCKNGGYRMWFRCPQCGQRVEALYFVVKYFLCRHCYDLTYTSRQENETYRLMRKARKIRTRLGASMALGKPIRIKPKNMHWKTFERLRKEAEDANRLSVMALLKWCKVEKDILLKGRSVIIKVKLSH